MLPHQGGASLLLSEVFWGFSLGKNRVISMNPPGLKQELGSVCTLLHCVLSRLNTCVCDGIEQQSGLDGCTLILSSMSTIKNELLNLLVPNPAPILNHYHIIRTLYGALSIKPNIEKITNHLVQMESTVNDLENMCQMLKLSNTF